VETVVLALRVALSLGVVLALLWVLQKRVARGRGGLLGTRRESTVTVVARQGVGAKASVVVVDVEGERLVLGVTEASISVLAAAEAPQPVEEPSLAPVARLVPAEPYDDPFAQVLARQAATGAAPAAALTATPAATPTAAPTTTSPVTPGAPALDALPLRPRGAARSAAVRRGPAREVRRDVDLRERGRAARALDGSILSPATWRQAAAVLRSRRAG